jgi:hypothetical protein
MRGVPAPDVGKPLGSAVAATQLFARVSATRYACASRRRRQVRGATRCHLACGRGALIRCAAHGADAPVFAQCSQGVHGPQSRRAGCAAPAPPLRSSRVRTQPLVLRRVRRGAPMSSASADWRQCSQGVHAPQTRRLDRAAPCTRVVAVHGARLAACAAQSAAGPPAHAWQLQHMRALTLVSVPSQRRRAGPAAAMPLLQGSQARILPFEWRATQRCARAGACRSSVRLTHLSSPVALRSHRRPCQQRLRRCCRTANVRTQLQGKRGLRRGAPMARLAVAASVLTTVAAAPERTAAAVLSEYQGAGPCARAAHGCWHCRC